MKLPNSNESVNGYDNEDQSKLSTLRPSAGSWVFAHANGDRPGWATMASRLFDLARKLNA
jgi:hypothetical protein